MITGVAGAGQGDAAPCGRSLTTHPPPKLEELKHKYNQKLIEAQEANDEQEATYFSGVVNGIQIAARELLSE